MTDAASRHTQRHHAGFLALVALGFSWCAFLAVNSWAQRAWLTDKWTSEFTPRWALVAACALLSGAAVVRLARAWRAGRWTTTSLRPLRWGMTCLVAAWIALWRWEAPAPKQDLFFAAAYALGAWSALWLVVPLHDAAHARRWVRVLDLALFELAACALAGELALRGLRATTHHPLLMTALGDPDAWLAMHRKLPGLYRFGFPINSEGFVDVEPSQAKEKQHLVACIGDSFSVAVVPHDRHYTTVAERAFDSLEVYNIGVVNAGPREYLRLLETSAKPLKPELIVVALFLGNDVRDADRRDVNELTSLFDLDELLLVQVPRRAYALLAERDAATLLASKAREDSAFSIPSDMKLSPAEVDVRLPWLDDPLGEPPALTDARFEQIERWRAEDTTRVRISDYHNLLRYLDELRDAAAPIPIAFLLFPDEFQVEEHIWQPIERELAGTEVERFRPQKVVGEALEARGLPYSDVLPALRAADPLSDGRRHVFHRNDTHFNTRGNVIAGEALAALIERCGVASRTKSGAPR